MNPDLAVQAAALRVCRYLHDPKAEKPCQECDFYAAFCISAARPIIEELTRQNYEKVAADLRRVLKDQQAARIARLEALLKRAEPWIGHEDRRDITDRLISEIRQALAGEGS